MNHYTTTIVIFKNPIVIVCKRYELFKIKKMTMLSIKGDVDIVLCTLSYGLKKY